MPATNSAPIVGSSMRAIKLLANQRNPFMRQIQNPPEASEAYQSTYRHRLAARFGSWGRAGFVVGDGHSVPTAIAAGKNNNWDSASQWKGFQSR